MLLLLKPLALVFLLPPLNGLAVVCLGLALGARAGRTGRVLACAGAVMLLLTSLPIIADSLIAGLERGITMPAPGVAGASRAPGAAAAPGAIVILSGDGTTIVDGGGLRTDVGPLSLERLRAGARLARQTRLPVLITGGPLGNRGAPIGIVMAEALADDFAIAPRWVESGAQDTWENASLSAPMLRDAGITCVYVVTHAWHMRRALIAFRAAGIEAIPAPVALDAWPDPQQASAWIPRVSSWVRCYYAMHEWVGYAWYRHRAA